MAIKIHDLRLSFIWVETILDMLKGTTPANAPMLFLGTDTGYAREFDLLQAGNGAKNLNVPWHKGGRGVDFFWTYYLEGKSPEDLRGAGAWKQLVPFRMTMPVTIKAPWFSGGLYLDGFYYPHGFALVFRAEWRGKLALSLGNAVKLAFNVRQDEQFTVQLDGGPVKQRYLDDLAKEALDYLRTAALGPDAQPGAATVIPFSVFTVVRGEGVDPTKPLPDGGKIHQALEAVTTWNPNYKTAILPKLTDPEHNVRLRSKRSPGDVVYGNTRGRAVWLPGVFTLPPGHKHSAACYHRNLIHTSMQVESLSNFLRQTAQEIKQPGDGLNLPLHQYYSAKRAGGILTRMYAAAKDKTYRSGSPYLHIRQNNFLQDVNKIRTELNVKGDLLV
jgi:hypothetical protein